VIFTMLTVVLTLASAAPTAFAAEGNPGVLPPLGNTYAQLSAKWWRYVLSFPAATNPLLDPTGADCAAGQQGKVFFLVGSFIGPVVREECIVPAGAALFFPVIDIVDVAKRHGARILIDEAHSTFLFGPNGRGVSEHFGLDDQVDFHLGTFSKSLGGQGGFVAGSKELVDYVTGFGRSRFFSCNLAPALAAGLLAGVKIVENEPALRAHLWSNVAYLRRRFAE